MAKDKKSFVAYTDWNKTFEKLSDDEAGKLAKMMFSYVNDENPDAPDRITELLFEPFKNQLKRDLKSYEKTLDEKSRKGRMGNLKRWNIDLYAKVTDELMELEEAEEIAKHRHSDKFIATAIKPSQKIADTEFVDDIVIDNETDILLEKETKEINLSDQVLQDDFSDDIFSTRNGFTYSEDLKAWEKGELEPIIPDSQEKQKEKICAKKEKAPPPDLETFLLYAQEVYQEELKIDYQPYDFTVRAKYQSWIEAGWKDGNKNPIQNWKSKLKNTIPHLKPIYGKFNSNNTNNGFTTQNGNSNGGVKISGKKSASAILAERARKQFAGDCDSGNQTTET
jgi:hypothetical protein